MRKIERWEIWNYNDRIMEECEMDICTTFYNIAMFLISHKLYCIKSFFFVRKRDIKQDNIKPVHIQLHFISITKCILWSCIIICCRCSIYDLSHFIASLTVIFSITFFFIQWTTCCTFFSALFFAHAFSIEHFSEWWRLLPFEVTSIQAGF
jgi:hypothetical protein